MTYEVLVTLGILAQLTPALSNLHMHAHAHAPGWIPDKDVMQ